jgi:3-phenylpropionate/trans-cinnamate dioxygenase ferredoxin reductase component
MTDGRLLIVGGGPAGLAAARAYREAGGDGEVILISADEYLPYNRPPLSKDYLRGETEEESLPLETPDFYTEHGIQARLRTSAEALDCGRRALTLADGQTIAYRRCILATGATPAPLPVPGADHPDIRLLRSRRNARHLRQAAARARSAIVVGSGFIGCEAAASLARRGLSVTVATTEELPQAERLGAAAGQRLRSWLAGEGVALRFGVQVTAIEAGHRLLLEDGDGLEADLILVAGGVTPNTAVAADSGLVITRGRLAADAAMRTSDPAVLTAGDVAYAVNAAAGRPLMVEHWGEAMTMGQIAGQTAAGQETAWAEVPGFWSVIGDRTLKYAAWGDGYDQARLDEHEAGAFTVWYERDGAAVGVLTHEADSDYERGRELIEAGRPVPPPGRSQSGG